jgi:hypothetical protein
MYSGVSHLCDRGIEGGGEAGDHASLVIEKDDEMYVPLVKSVVII